MHIIAAFGTAISGVLIAVFRQELLNILRYVPSLLARRDRSSLNKLREKNKQLEQENKELRARVDEFEKRINQS